ncbi:MAG: TfoX/Sxy family protein [Thiothrix sp.]
MPKQSEYVTYLLELLAPLGQVSARSMFGGHGIYRDDVMFGLVADETLYFKVTTDNQAAYEQAGSQPFSYSKKDGKVAVMSYWTVPADLLEDQDQLLEWAREAYNIALKSKAPPKRRKTTKP